MNVLNRWLPAIAGALLLTACGTARNDTATVHTSNAQTALSAQQIQAIAKEAYIYGTPIVAEYQTMYAFSIDKGNPEYKGPFNSMLNIARVFTPDDTAFVTPNSDTPYSMAGLDLRAEPIVLTVPPIEKRRYFVFQLMDQYTYNFAYIGSRTTGNQGGRYLIAGPDWNGSTPPGITKVFKAETQFVSVVGRTQLFSPQDLPNVKRIQGGYRLQTLSQFLNKPAPSPAPTVQWPPALTTEQARTSTAFFDQLAFLLQFTPTHPSETALRARFAQIGLVPGQPYDAARLPPAQQAALLDGMKQGQAEIDRRRASLDGKTDTLFGDRAYLKDDYVARATGTQVGIGANSREEALYPVLEKDTSGQALDGSKAAYRLRFKKGELPPVNAFWSMTMYGLPDQLLVHNRINRYLINSPMLPNMKRDADGGYTIYVQAQSPGQALETNWLPAPEGPFMVTMRYYWPKDELLNGNWTSPSIERVR